jgi:adenylylsulfate kinase
MPKRNLIPKHKGVHSKKASLFVGRWQPFHKGHRSMIEPVLKSGKPVVIAIRDTDLSEENPYSVPERRNMIQRWFKKYGDLVNVVVIPDIDEICYGRNVGYAIRRISHAGEAISGTKIRKRLKKKRLLKD